jgi:hypothetical protein
MYTKHELSIEELDAELTTDLPEREALGVFTSSNTAMITAFNQALAMNVFSDHANAFASAQQYISVDQSNN